MLLMGIITDNEKEQKAGKYMSIRVANIPALDPEPLT